MKSDRLTSSFYAAEAAAYTARGQAPNTRHLQDFMAALPAGGAVLELGCGAGQDSEALIAHGFDVTPTDGIAAIARAAARRLGRPVRTLPFDALDARDAYDGIWANACLLHVPRADLKGILARIHAALRPGGVAYASFKAGTAEGRDRFGRYFNYPSPDWLEHLYRALPWRALRIVQECHADSGYDRAATTWLHVTATRPP